MTGASAGLPASVTVEELGGVLFDMDGTVVDSERLWTVAMDRVAAELGGEVSPATRLALVGASIPLSVELLLADFGLTPGVAGPDGVVHDIEGTTALLLAFTAEIFAEDLLWQPGAQELIDAIRDAGLRTALVTNSPRSVVDVALGLLGDHRFDATICGDEVTHGKPAPDPYLQAMGLLGLTAAQCLAVEDSPSGTAAAVAAGIPVLVVPSEVDVPEGPGRIFASSLLGATVQELHHIHHEFRRSRHAAE